MSDPDELADDDRSWADLDQTWVIAIIFYGLGDAATTGIGIHIGGLVEAGPFVAPLLERYGLGVMFLLKIGVLGGMFALWQRMPRPQRLGVPLGLAAVGVVVTTWNASLLAVTALS
jgi:hypothetical protein